MIAVSTGSLHGAFHKLEQEGSLVEMTSRTKLWALSAGALALSLALAGCGSSGGGSAAGTAPTPAPATPPGVTDQAEPRGVAGLFAVALTAADDAEAAAKAAAAAVTAATGASEKLSTEAVNGNSMMAEDNAQAVLDAQTAAMTAVTDAETAQKAAEDALVEAMDVSDDDPNKASLIAALEAAIEDAKAQVALAKTSAESEELKTAVAAVQNPDGGATPPDPLKTPSDAGQAVAMAIGTAIGPDGTITHDAVPETPDMATDVINTTDDSMGMTWAMIVGAEELMEERLGADRTVVQVASISGMAAADVHTALTLTGGTDGGAEYADGAEQSASTYNGIPGTVYCLGTDCKVEGEAGSEMLTGSWYFTPTNAEQNYVPNAADEGSYMVETDYASYGYWFRVAQGGAVTLNTFADKGDNTAGNGDTDTAASDTLAGTAEYAGSAIGMSVYKTFSAGKQTSIASGEFTATVGLTATFGGGADAGVKGTVDGFVGPAVDGGWSVDLERAAFGANGVADGGGEAGVWANDTYGPDDERPVGIFGTFNAHFSNGHAAGAYATRKD